ncbi:MAG: AAA family ATPase [Atopobiaceae bacterium]
MLERAIYQHLAAWKADANHTALLIDGARQVGKTFAVREFAKGSYRTTLEINFVQMPSAKTIFEGDLDADALIANLTAFSEQPLHPGNTLIFLDEIQECPQARTAIKFLVDDGRFDYIESGSLLGVSYREVSSLPVGYERTLRMYPLTISEFFSARGVDASIENRVRGLCEAGQPIPEAIHGRLTRLFRIYLAVGGMPAAVQRYVDTHDLARVLLDQQAILGLYRQDITRYASDKMHIRAIFNALPSELDAKNKRFKLSDLSKSARSERYASDFMWLADSGVALPCYNTTAPQTPLEANKKHNLFKLFLCDVGLLSAASSIPAQFDLVQGDPSINWGSFLENALAQEFSAHGFGLYYYDKQGLGEVDFLLQRGIRVLPVEAKSGKEFHAHASLDKVLGVGEWGIDEAVVFCGGNVERDGKITYLPWYASAFLERDNASGSFVVSP